MTTTTINTCDKCHKQAPYFNIRGTATVPMFVNKFFTCWPYKTIRLDLCPSCARAFKAWMNIESEYPEPEGE